jgi:transposase
VRATTAFNKMLAIPGADVAGVQFTPSGIVVGLRRRGRRLHCPCGWSTRAVYDRSIRRWRHLDLGAARRLLEAEIRRLACRAGGRVRTETVAWARAGCPVLYRLPPGGRPDAHLDAWLVRASRCRIPAMLDLSRTIRRHRDQILAAVDLGLSNSKLEGLNSKIGLINHRGYGHHSAAAVIAMIYLCCSGLTITLPTGR